MSSHAIHHVTAITAKIGKNLEFYTGILGLRLVKRSVNQDDVSAYHLFYADAVGSPGTDMTFFDWPLAARNRPGPMTIALTSFRIAEGSLEFWVERLRGAGAAPELVDGSILFADEEGQRLELVPDTFPTHAVPWDKEVPAEHALRGILGVDLESARPDGTRQVLKDVLGYEETSEGVFVTGDENAHARVRLAPMTSEEWAGRTGAGGVHHVAFRVADDDELYRLMEKAESLGLRSSGYVDRFYFHSVYFREPGGILFELATDGPGFASDESMESLGQKLALPPFLEGRREEIEAGLKPLPI